MAVLGVLVTEKQATYQEGQAEYSPAGLDRILSRWQELLVSAEVGPSVQGMQRDEGGGDPAYSNPFWAINTIADVERAWAHLPGPLWTLQRRVIELRMQGHCISVSARELRCRYETVAAADTDARRWMACFLGWRDAS